MTVHGEVERFVSPSIDGLLGFGETLAIMLSELSGSIEEISFRLNSVPGSSG